MVYRQIIGWNREKLNRYNIAENEFKILQVKTESIYNALVVVDYFCQNQKEIEELCNIAPIIENLRKDADYMNAFFINYDNID